METNDKIDLIARNAYLKQPDMVLFLLTENLALKTLLAEKGVISPEEFKMHKESAVKILKGTIDSHIQQWKEANQETVRLYEESQQQYEKMMAVIDPAQKEDPFVVS